MFGKKTVFIRLIAATLIAAFVVQDIAQAGVSTASVAPASVHFPAVFEAPSEFASLKEIHRGTEKPFLIHMQDAHMNLSGQENLAAALDDMMARYPLDLVLVEGGTRDDTLTPIKRVASSEVWKRVAKKFLIEGKITGEEYLNLTSDRPMKILGIEDEALYMKSLTAYADLASRREATLATLAKIQLAIEALKPKLYPGALKEYEKKAGKLHGEGRETFAEEAFKELLKLAGEEDAALTEGLPNLARLREIQKKEISIDFDRANLEQAALVAEIEKRGGAGSLKDHLAKNSREGETSASHLSRVQALFRLAANSNIAIHTYPELQEYAAYLFEFSKLDLDALGSETARFEDRVYAKLLADEDPKLLRAIDRYTGLLSAAYKIKMTAHEFELFKTNETDFATENTLAFLNRKLVEYARYSDVVDWSTTLNDSKASLEAFYASVAERDHAFMRNTEKALSDHEKNSAILIAGGYHTPHLKELMREKGWSYAVLTPLVDGETDQKKYEKLLLEPLQKESRESSSSAAPRRSGASALEVDLQATRSKGDGIRTQATAEALSGARLAEIVEAAANNPDDAAAAMLEYQLGHRTPAIQATVVSDAPVKLKTGARLADISETVVNLLDSPPASILNVDWKIIGQQRLELKYWLSSGNSDLLPTPNLLRKIFIHLLNLYIYERGVNGQPKIWVTLLSSRWGITPDHLKNLLRWFKYSELRLDRVSDAVFYDFMKTYIESYRRYPDLRNNFVYNIPLGITDDEKLKITMLNTQHMLQLVPESVIRGKKVLEANIKDTPFSIQISYGLVEATHGLYIALYEKGSGTTAPREIIRMGLDTQRTALRINMIQGVEGEQRSINVFFPDVMGIHPALAMFYFILELANKGYIGPHQTGQSRQKFMKILGIRPEYIPTMHERFNQKATKPITINIMANYGKFAFWRKSEFARWRDLEGLNNLWLNRLQNKNLKETTGMLKIRDAFRHVREISVLDTKDGARLAEEKTGEFLSGRMIMAYLALTAVGVSIFYLGFYDALSPKWLNIIKNMAVFSAFTGFADYLAQRTLGGKVDWLKVRRSLFFAGPVMSMATAAGYALIDHYAPRDWALHPFLVANTRTLASFVVVRARTFIYASLSGKGKTQEKQKESFWITRAPSYAKNFVIQMLIPQHASVVAEGLATQFFQLFYSWSVHKDGFMVKNERYRKSRWFLMAYFFIAPTVGAARKLGLFKEPFVWEISESSGARSATEFGGPTQDAKDGARLAEEADWAEAERALSELEKIYERLTVNVEPFGVQAFFQHVLNNGISKVLSMYRQSRKEGHLKRSVKTWVVDALQNQWNFILSFSSPENKKQLTEWAKAVQEHGYEGSLSPSDRKIASFVLDETTPPEFYAALQAALKELNALYASSLNILSKLSAGVPTDGPLMDLQREINATLKKPLNVNIIPIGQPVPRGFLFVYDQRTFKPFSEEPDSPGVNRLVYYVNQNVDKEALLKDIASRVQGARLSDGQARLAESEVQSLLKALEDLREVMSLEEGEARESELERMNTWIMEEDWLDNDMEEILATNALTQNFGLGETYGLLQAISLKTLEVLPAMTPDEVEAVVTEFEKTLDEFNQEARNGGSPQPLSVPVVLLLSVSSIYDEEYVPKSEKLTAAILHLPHRYFYRTVAFQLFSLGLHMKSNFSETDQMDVRMAAPLLTLAFDALKDDRVGPEEKKMLKRGLQVYVNFVFDKVLPGSPLPGDWSSPETQKALNIHRKEFIANEQLIAGLLELGFPALLPFAIYLHDLEEIYQNTDYAGLPLDLYLLTQDSYSVGARLADGQARLAESPITLAMEGAPLKDQDEALKVLPARLYAALASSLEADQAAAALSLMSRIEKAYASLGINQLYYHNHTHNLIVASAFLILAARRDLLTTPRDIQTAFLAGLLHDFHLRPPGVPANVDETIRQLRDLLGLEAYPEDLHSSRNYRAYASVDRQLFQKEILGVLGVTNVQDPEFAERWVEIETMIRRTDYAAPDADAPRPAEIETFYAESLQRVASQRLDRVHELSRALEQGADRAGVFWLGSSALSEEMANALANEGEPAAAWKNLLFIKAYLMRREVLETLGALSARYQYNFVETVDRSVELAKKAMADVENREHISDQERMDLKSAVQFWADERERLKKEWSDAKPYFSDSQVQLEDFRLKLPEGWRSEKEVFVRIRETDAGDVLRIYRPRPLQRAWERFYITVERLFGFAKAMRRFDDFNRTYFGGLHERGVFSGKVNLKKDKSYGWPVWKADASVIVRTFPKNPDLIEVRLDKTGARLSEQNRPTDAFGLEIPRDASSFKRYENVSADRILSDFIVHAFGSEEYNKTISAMSVSSDLLLYTQLRALYGVISAPEKKADIPKILRAIQFQALSIGGGTGRYENINRRTWAGRADATLETVYEALQKFRSEKPQETFLIGDFAVSDGTSSLELAEYLIQKGAGNFKILAYDKLLRYKTPVSEIDLINPEVEDFMLRHPGILEFTEHDVFEPLAETFHVIRVLNLLHRGGASYFDDTKVREGLATLGQSLAEGGTLINGSIPSSRFAQLDIFERTADELRMVEVTNDSLVNRDAWNISLRPADGARLAEEIFAQDAAEDLWSAYRSLSTDASFDVHAIWDRLFAHRTLFEPQSLTDVNELAALLEELRSDGFKYQFTRQINTLYKFVSGKVSDADAQRLRRNKARIMGFFFERLGSEVKELDLKTATRLPKLGEGGGQYASRYDQAIGSFAVVRNKVDEGQKLRFNAQEDIFKTINPLGERNDLPFLLKVNPVTPDEEGVIDRLLIEQRFPEGRPLEYVDFRQWTTRQKFLFALSVAKTMEYLDSQNVVHRDLKPLNIWVPKALTADQDWDKKAIAQHPPIVFDFDTSVLFSESERYQDIIREDSQSRSVLGTAGYTNLTREAYILQNQKDSSVVNPKKDLFSFGVVFSELFDESIHNYLQGGFREVWGLRIFGHRIKLKTRTVRQKEIRRILKASDMENSSRAMLYGLLRLNVEDIDWSWSMVVNNLGFAVDDTEKADIPRGARFAESKYPFDKPNPYAALVPEISGKRVVSKKDKSVYLLLAQSDNYSGVSIYLERKTDHTKSIFPVASIADGRFSMYLEKVSLKNGETVDLVFQGLGAQIFSILSEALPAEYLFQSTVRNVETREALFKNYVVKEGRVVRRSDGFIVVEGAPQNGEVSLQTILEETLVGKILKAGSFKNFKITMRATDDVILSNLDALEELLENRTAEERGAVGEFSLSAVKAGARLAEDADKQLLLGFVPGRLEESGYLNRHYREWVDESEDSLQLELNSKGLAVKAGDFAALLYSAYDDVAIRYYFKNEPQFVGQVRWNAMLTSSGLLRVFIEDNGLGIEPPKYSPEGVALDIVDRLIGGREISETMEFFKYPSATVFMDVNNGVRAYREKLEFLPTHEILKDRYSGIRTQQGRRLEVILGLEDEFSEESMLIDRTWTTTGSTDRPAGGRLATEKDEPTQDAKDGARLAASADAPDWNDAKIQQVREDLLSSGESNFILVGELRQFQVLEHKGTGLRILAKEANTSGETDRESIEKLVEAKPDGYVPTFLGRGQNTKDHFNYELDLRPFGYKTLTPEELRDRSVRAEVRRILQNLNRTGLSNYDMHEENMMIRTETNGHKKILLIDSDFLKPAQVNFKEVRSRWLSEKPITFDKSVDLQGIDLSGLEGERLIFRYAMLRWADLSHSKFQDADFAEALLDFADLSGTDLRGSDFTNSNLIGANISNSIIEGPNLDLAAIYQTIVSEDQLKELAKGGSIRFYYDLGRSEWLISNKEGFKAAGVSQAEQRLYLPLKGTRLSESEDHFLRGARLATEVLTTEDYTKLPASEIALMENLAAFGDTRADSAKPLEIRSQGNRFTTLVSFEKAADGLDVIFSNLTPDKKETEEVARYRVTNDRIATLKQNFEIQAQIPKKMAEALEKSPDFHVLQLRHESDRFDRLAGRVDLNDAQFFEPSRPVILRFVVEDYFDGRPDELFESFLRDKAAIQARYKNVYVQFLKNQNITSASDTYFSDSVPDSAAEEAVVMVIGNAEASNIAFAEKSRAGLTPVDAALRDKNAVPILPNQATMALAIGTARLKTDEKGNVLSIPDGIGQLHAMLAPGVSTQREHWAKNFTIMRKPSAAEASWLRRLAIQPIGKLNWAEALQWVAAQLKAVGTAA